MTFSAIVVSHANERGLRNILGQLRYQTRPPDETIVFFSGDGYDAVRLREHFPEAAFSRVPDENDWGHGKRDRGIAAASCSWIGFFNDDDTYDRRYLERMLAASDGHDAVYCAWNEQPSCDFRLTHSTAGNFVCRTDLAREAGWTDRVYEADGLFIERLNALTTRVARVNTLLYHHNVQ